MTVATLPASPATGVGSDGSVWSSRVAGANGKNRGATGPWKRVTAHRRTYGARYVVVCLRAIPGGRISCRYVHRLVLEAFVGPCPEGMECRHFPDRDTSNNRVENLAWATHQDNLGDKKAHGTDPKAVAAKRKRLAHA